MNKKQLYLLMFLLMVIVLVLNKKEHIRSNTDNVETTIDSKNLPSQDYSFDNSLKQRKPYYKLGLALSGGGIKGFCHVGVLKALDEKGLRPDIISGVSSGAIVAALYADGYSPDSIVEIFDKIHLLEYFRLDLNHGGFMGMNGFRELLDTVLRAKTFEELSIPLRIVATDLDHGKSVVFDSGNLADAIVASCSVPILFSPYVINGVNYVDGGILKNLPASTIRNDCKVLIGVSAGPMKTDAYEKSITEIALRSYLFIYRSNITQERKLCDILIEPSAISGFTGASMNKLHDILDLGYKETTKILNTDRSEKMLSQLKKPLNK
jgi:NTE family protein